MLGLNDLAQNSVLQRQIRRILSAKAREDAPDASDDSSDEETSSPRKRRRSVHELSSQIEGVDGGMDQRVKVKKERVGSSMAPPLVPSGRKGRESTVPSTELGGGRNEAAEDEDS